MLKIEYEINLNDKGRPFILLSDEYEDKPEDKFFVLELTNYLLYNVYKNNNTFDSETISKLDDCINIIRQISDEVAALIYGQMETMGEVALITDDNYHVKVDSMNSRNDLKDKFVYNNKIFTRKIGLKVLVEETEMIYVLEGGVDNENWFEVT
jgi:hypothetical protein